MAKDAVRDPALPSEAVHSVCQDGEGRIWAGVGSGGLVRSKENTWNVLPAGDVWQEAATCVGADRHGRLWVGTQEQGLHASEQSVKFPFLPARPHPTIA